MRADCLAIVGRGAVWLWAGGETARAAYALRYGQGGRDGREVWADWTFWGQVPAPESGDPARGAGSGRRGRAFMRAAVAGMLREARERAREQMAAAAWHASHGNGRLAGACRGAAIRNLSLMRGQARLVARLIDGKPLDPATFAKYVRSRDALTELGRTMAYRFRKHLDKRDDPPGPAGGAVAAVR